MASDGAGAAFFGALGGGFILLSGDTIALHKHKASEKKKKKEKKKNDLRNR